MQAFLQTLHEQYRTEYYGPWHTRECYPWEYDVKAQECIQLASKSDPQFFLPQAKILQDRAAYIRQEWARLEALQAIQLVTQLVTHQITMAMAIGPLQARVTSDDAYLDELKPSDVLL
ncbi:hypothetical protein HO133_011014 [Letharia lupina]|uniref:Uncharacterized protein n=1 Tax=Letharia lupina TaxID=560253 RepID=A0A8H6FDF7_9LECA|nr:uncharacterized protein HO133_011014 [Letharia lupina]KAF6224437.1 hypothetical protein HO133_011014 [Letharia lupina]